MKKNHVQGTEVVTSHEELKDTKRSRCRQNAKRVGATCCNRNYVVAIDLSKSVSEALHRAAYYIETLPQRIREVELAANAVLEEGRRQGA